MTDDGMVRDRRAVEGDAEHAAPYGRPRMERRRDRRGRNLLDAWMLVIGAAVVLVAVAVAARALWTARPVAQRPVVAAQAAGKSPGPSAKATEAKVAVTAVFARIGKYGVEMHLPAVPSDMVAVGFHQAWNTKATDMRPALTVHPKDAYADTKQALRADPSLKLFLMMSRGRGSSDYSAADSAVKPGAIILSPVTGVVTLVKTYKLAGVGTDFQVEIKADGAEPVRVVLIHLTDITVKVGERVEGGLTPLGTVRHLPIESQVNRYLPVPADHTHIQINAVGYRLNEGS